MSSSSNSWLTQFVLCLRELLLILSFHPNNSYVDAAAHDNFTASAVYQQMLKQTEEQAVLRGAPVLTVVGFAGGFKDRSHKS
jgi:hypothetical protein